MGRRKHPKAQFTRCHLDPHVSFVYRVSFVINRYERYQTDFFNKQQAQRKAGQYSVWNKVTVLVTKIEMPWQREHNYWVYAHGVCKYATVEKPDLSPDDSNRSDIWVMPPKQPRQKKEDEFGW